MPNAPTAAILSPHLRRAMGVVGALAVAALPLLYAGMYAGDAAIHLVFAENAAAGHPFQFNRGEVSAGVTSPGYMFLLAALWRLLGAAVMPYAVKLLNLAAWYGVVALTWRLGRRLGLAWGFCLAGTLSVGLMPGSAYNATVGMENGMFALPVLALALLATKRRLLGPNAPAAAMADAIAGVMIGTAFWLRPEAALVGAVWFPSRLAAVWRSRRGRTGVIAAALMALALAVAELLLHHAYTGAWLPGSARARAVFGTMDGFALGPLVVNAKFSVRLAAYGPLTLLAALGAASAWRWRGRDHARMSPTATGPLADPAARRALVWLLSLFVLAWLAYSTVLGAAHLARYTIFVWPGLGLMAAAGGEAAWAAWPTSWRGWRAPTATMLAVALAVVYGYEAWTRSGLGPHDVVKELSTAPAQRSAYSDALLDRMGRPEVRPLTIAYQEVQLRYMLDDRFVVRSLDGRTDPALLDYVHDGWIDHLGYIRDMGIDALLELPDYNRVPGHWAPADLIALPVGQRRVIEGLVFTRVAADIVRVERQSLARAAVLPDAERVRLISPSDGAHIRVSWIPLTLFLARPFLGGRIQVRIDGREATDPLAVFSSRGSQPELGRYIATLDLAPLEPGEHRLEIELSPLDGDRSVRMESVFFWDRPPCPVDLEVVDGAGAPISARVAIFTPDGPYLLTGPDAAEVDPRDRDTKLHSVFVIGGRGRVWLDHGGYRMIAVRGVRDEIDEHEIELAECDRPTVLRFTVERSVATPDRVTADFHVHTGSSSDSYVPDRPRYASLVAADLDVAVTTDHNVITDPARALEAVENSDRTTLGLAGVEARIGPRAGPDGERAPSAGHINIFPLDPAASLPPTDSYDLAEHIDNYHALQKLHPDPTGAHPLIQLNHPRGLFFDPWKRKSLNRTHALFNWMGFDRKTPLGQGVNDWLLAPRPESGTRPIDFDALEVLNRWSWGAYIQVRADWFLLMNLGHFHSGTGNSDSHALAVELAGFPVNLVRLPPASRDPEIDVPAFIDAVRAGRLDVSTGPVIDLTVQTPRGDIGRPGDLLAAEDRRVTVSVTVRAASWVPVHEVRLVVDGQVTRTERLVEPLPEGGGTVRAEFSWPLDLERDAWVLVEAGWPIDDPLGPVDSDLGVYADVVPYYVPLAFTNPVRIDVEDDRVWSPLPPEEALKRAAPMPTDVPADTWRGFGRAAKRH